MHCPQGYCEKTCHSKIMIKVKEYYIMIERMILMTSKFTISPMNIALGHCFCYNLEKKGNKCRIGIHQDHKYKIWIKSCLLFEEKEINIIRITLKIAGSFISFHMPSTPLEMKSLTKLAHHARTFDCV